MKNPEFRIITSICCALGVTVLAGCTDTSAHSKADAFKRPATAQAAYERLVAGNKRFAAKEPSVTSVAEFEEMFMRNDAGQTPYATILTCADSRLSPAMLFDEVLGQLFVVREAGNISTSPTSLGSLEFGHGVLKTSLLVVMGHENCGAVEAALNNSDVPGHIRSFVDVIKPGIAGASDLPEAVAKNVNAVMQSIRANSPALHDAMMVGAVYNLATGKVRFLGKPTDS